MRSYPTRGDRSRVATLLTSVGLLALFSNDPTQAQSVTVTVDAGALYSIGGERQLERTKYFNHWGTHVITGNTNLGNLATEVWAEDGLNSATGRETWEFDAFIAKNVPQDPARPGYFDVDALRLFLRSGTNGGFGTYNSFLNNHIRYQSVREHENHVMVQSGRAEANWPSWLLAGTDLPVSHGGAAYAEFLNVYLEEVVYGTGPQIGGSQSQGYLPLDPENFYIEIMNEPSWELGPGGLDWDDVIEMHRTVTEKVKSENPDAQIGGASVGNANFASWNPYRWEYKKQLMDDMVNWRTESGEKAEFDFWTFHPYDSRVIQSDGTVSHRIPESSGHLDGILDLFESYSYQKFGDPKRIAVTEYGTIQWSEYNGGDFGPYDRRLMQWDELTDVKKKMLTFLDRPDRIVNATPFIAPQWWSGSTPTEHAGASNVFWDRNANGTWTETIAAGFYRMLNDVQGQYIDIESADDEIQVAAFRDGNKLHLVFNNLSDSLRVVDLQAMLGDASVAQATLDRVYWDGTAGAYVDDVDALSFWQTIPLTAEEASKLTLTLDSPDAYTIATDRRTYYGDDTQTPINLSGGRSKVINITADTEDAISATARIAISGRNNIWNESFSVVVNGNSILVPARGANGFDEHDNALFSREIDIPVALLNDGDNEVYVDFTSNGGDLVTATLVVTHTIGDFNGSGAFDSGDLDQLIAQFGPVSLGSKYDLAGADGVVDMADVEYWLRDLRGVSFDLLGDFNGDGVVGIADYTVWRDSLVASSESILSGNGDSFGLVDHTDYALWKENFGRVLAADHATGVAIPEPNSWTIVLIATLTGWLGGIRHRRGT